ncbi:MAG: hypothetical protein IKB25_08965 [Lentisphaeria bacterium]|nr:hypothetical protein [Lentisphaeria bacterium]
MLKKAAVFSLILLSSLFSVLNADEPVGVFRIQNTQEFIRKSSVFMSKVNEQAGGATAVFLNDGLLSKLTALDPNKPVTAYFYFAKPALQMVYFGSYLKGKKLEKVSALPGQNLVPEKDKSGGIVYADPKFKNRIKGLKADTIPLPRKILAGQYIFRENLQAPDNSIHNHDIAVFLSNEFDRFSFTVDFPSEDLLNAEVDFIAKKNSKMNEFSNRQHPQLKDRALALPKPEFYIYAELPAGQPAARGFIDVCTIASQDFANDEHILGRFLHTVLTGDHPAALMLSKNQDYYLFSGTIPSAERKAYFEKFLKSNGDSYSGKTYLFHNDDGTDIYVAIIGNTANLLIKKKNGMTPGISQTFQSLKPLRQKCSGREFLLAMMRNAEGSYEKMISSSMINGKFHFTLNLRPKAAFTILPRLFTGEDLFQE